MFKDYEKRKRHSESAIRGKSNASLNMFAGGTTTKRGRIYPGRPEILGRKEGLERDCPSGKSGEIPVLESRGRVGRAPHGEQIVIA